VAAASQLFTERGVTATTMAEIARRCGLQQPSLYYYFRSKGELLDEIVGVANRAPLELVARVRARALLEALRRARPPACDELQLARAPGAELSHEGRDRRQHRVVRALALELRLGVREPGVRLARLLRDPDDPCCATLTTPVARR
jgi:AcrR family transcriptional regulator